VRRSLFTRLLAVSVLVAVCSVAATAWLAARTATIAIQREQGQELADDARIYNDLLKYAAEHPKWDGVDEVVQRLARDTGRRITLTAQNHEPIADSATGHAELAAQPSAVVDPLAVDLALVPAAGPDRIDPRASGPFRLPQAELDDLKRKADEVLYCVRGRTQTGQVLERPNGHPYVDSQFPATYTSCGGDVLDQPTPTESAALTQLTDLVDACLGRQGQIGVKIDLTLRLSLLTAERPAQAVPDPETFAHQAQSCLTTARHEQLAPFVAAAALLFVAGPKAAATWGFDLSSGNQARIAGVAGLVLLLTVVATVLAGLRLVRPMRALTGAARRLQAGDMTARVQITGRDEIAQLGAAFNEMSASREKFEELRTTMVSDIAHELRTPLTNIRAWLEGAQDGVVERDELLVSSLLEETLQLQHIVDDLQDLAMADAGKLRLHQEDLHLADVLAQVASAHGARANTAGVELVVRSAEVGVRADPKRLRQIMDNLVSNALRHTGSGGTVTVNGFDQGDWAVVDVSDTGSGISAEDLPRVFDRFWRAEKSRNRDAGGSGLGLAIVRDLAEAHGGTVTAVSTLGRGSTFTLRLRSVQQHG
jgi:two-component system sensor histidine kinase BaeS